MKSRSDAKAENRTRVESRPCPQGVHSGPRQRRRRKRRLPCAKFDSRPDSAARSWPTAARNTGLLAVDTAAKIEATLCNAIRGTKNIAIILEII